METKEAVIENIKFVFHIYDEEDSRLLLEAKTKGKPLVGKYSYDLHQPHNPTGEYHIHGYEKNNEIFAINKSGSAHDGYHATVIPKKAYDALVRKFPNWNWPLNRLIESNNTVLFFEANTRTHLRPVKIIEHKNIYNLLEIVEEFIGFFHSYADVPIESAAKRTPRTLTIVEDMEGYLSFIPITCIQFLDT